VKHEKIAPQARIWVLSRGPDGKLHAEIDPALLAGRSPDDITDTLIKAAGDFEIAETRLW
jgi:hypothetical protein